MPIRPTDRQRYPENWRGIRAQMLERAGFVCECTGECGTVHQGGRCSEKHATLARSFNGLVLLTIAHLDHRPENSAPDNLRALCQRCHLRVDSEQHRQNARATRAAKQRGRATGDLFDGVGDA